MKASEIPNYFPMPTHENGEPRYNLKQEIVAEMETIPYTRKYRGTGFVSRGFIAQLFQMEHPNKLRDSLQQDLTKLSRQGLTVQKDISQLSGEVRDTAAKLYCVLLLLDRPEIVIQLLTAEPPITDEIFESIDMEGYGPYCPRAKLEELPLPRDIAANVFRMQWCIPPVFTRERHMSFPPESFSDFRFPFLEEPSYIDRGGYGAVMGVKLAEGQLITDDYEPGSTVAWKSIRRTSTMTLGKMLREVDSARVRPHKNIVPFFASFWAGQDDPKAKNDRAECMHIFFKHTDAGNMKAWLEQQIAPSGLSNPVARHDYIYSSMLDIVSGVAFIHRKVNGLTAFHHDLKPENILLFEEKPPTWKICDFGTAHTDDNRFGTYVYRPPEYFSSETESNPPRLGRAFDVYSLGAILLDLAIVLKYGWESGAYAEFRNQRGENTEHPYNGREKPKNDPDYSFHNNPRVVKSWIEELKKGHSAQKFYNLMDLIDEMLERESHKRIFAWEVEIALYEMVNPEAGEEDLRWKLLDVVQEPKENPNRLDRNDPIRRAYSKKKSWQVDILREKGWCPRLALPYQKQKTDGIYLSTLEKHQGGFDKYELFGRHKLDTTIMDTMIMQNLIGLKPIGLYGMSGIGKSHLAYNCISRFKDPAEQAQRKHTFWIDARSVESFNYSIWHIFVAIGSGIDTEKSPSIALAPVRSWLSDPSNGPWIMVVDHLVQDDVAQYIKRHLPDQGHGETIITAKDRAILRHFVELKDPNRCLFVGDLDIDDCREIFSRESDDLLSDEAQMGDILKSLKLPAWIKSEAIYLTNCNIKTALRHKEWEEGGRKHASCVTNSQKRLREALFEPVHRNGSSKGGFGKWPSSELRLLGILSCFNREKIELRLISQDFKPGDHDKIKSMLSVLLNCSYIESRGTSEPFYTMSGFVQAAIRQWIRENENLGATALMELQASAVCSLMRVYYDKRNENAQQPSYTRKLEFMQHFDRFLEFAKEQNPRKGEIVGFECTETMVKSVITFAHVYLHEGWYKDAEHVLEFTKWLYKDKIMLPNLNRVLASSYTEAPLARFSNATGRAEQLLKEAIEESRQKNNVEQKWRCTLDLAHLYSNTLRPEQAFTTLKSLPELELRKERGEPRLIPQNTSWAPKPVQEELAILKEIQYGKAHVARVEKIQTLEDPETAKVSSELQNAKVRFDRANSARSSWSPNNHVLRLGIGNGVIKLLNITGDVESLVVAIEIYDDIKSLVGRYHDLGRPGSQKPLWDAECEEAMIQLKLYRRDLHTSAVKRLQKLLFKYQECYGPKDQHTRKCAYELRIAYEKMGLNEEARILIKDYDLDSIRSRMWLTDCPRRPETGRNLRNLSAQRNHESGPIKSYYRFVFTRSLVSAIQDVCKKTVEHLAGTRLSWWPLSEPEETLKANYTRVYSLIDSSRRNRSFYDDIPSSLADKLFHGLAAARSMAPETRWETLRHEGVFLESTTLMRLLCSKNMPSPIHMNQVQETKLATKDVSDVSEQAPSPRSMGEQPSAGNKGRDIEMKEMGAELANHVPMDNRKKDPNDSENVKPLTRKEVENKLDDTKPVLFLSLDILTNDSRACSVDVGMNDLNMMANLRDSYNALRSSFLWNRKRPVGVKFYRFRSFLYKSERRHHIQLHRDQERYPPRNDGDYDWNLGNEWQDGDPYPNGEAWYFFSHPGDCGNSTTLREMLPKRRKDELRSGKTVYGLYIEQRHSVLQIVIPVVLVLGFTLGGTLWFISPWLRDHPDDLQGATVPVFLAFTVVQFILTLLTTLVVFRWSL